jgi:hydroxymethylbilane synthase
MNPVRLAIVEDSFSRESAARIAETLASHDAARGAVVVCVETSGIAPDVVKLLSSAILTGCADAAVCPAPLVPRHLPDGVAVGAILPQGDPSYLCLSAGRPILSLLPTGSRVVTSCLLARSQILHRFPWLWVQVAAADQGMIEGLRRGQWDAACLPPEAIASLGPHGMKSEPVSRDCLMPAVGQGLSALIVPGKHGNIVDPIHGLFDESPKSVWRCERAFAQEASGFAGSLSAAVARIDGHDIVLKGMLVERDGTWMVLDEATAQVGFAPVVAQDLAESCKEMARAEGARAASRTAGVAREGGKS